MEHINLKPENVKAGDTMAFIFYGKVKNIVARGKEHNLEVVGENGHTFFVEGNDLITKSYSADQYLTTHKRTKTQLAQILVKSYNKPMSVCFIKANGQERIIKCKLLSSEDLMGRSMVCDLEEKNTSPIRQIDHRTIKWIIVNGIKYEES